MAINLLCEMSDGWWHAYVESASSPALDRNGISTAFANMLKNDTSILYGASNFLQIIEPNPIRFAKAKVNNSDRYGLYLWAEPEDTQDVRSQNEDEQFIINMRFEGINLDPENAEKQIDDAYQRVKVLVNTQMHDGQMMTDWYTDTRAQIFNIEPVTSSLPAPEPEGNQKITIEIEGAILVEVNRWR